MINPQHIDEPSKTLHVLIIADSNWKETPIRLLSADDYQLEFASDGVDGLHKAYEILPDLIITDMAISNTNGFQLCRLLKNDPVTRKIPIILITQDDCPIQRFWQFKTGADAVIRRSEVNEHLAEQARLLFEIYSQIEFEEKQRLRNGLLPKARYNAAGRLNQQLDTLLVESSLVDEFRKLHDLVSDVSVLNFMLFSLVNSLLNYDLALVYYHEAQSLQPWLTFHIPDDKVISQELLNTLAETFKPELQSMAPDYVLPETLRYEVVGVVAPPVESGTEIPVPPINHQTRYVRHLFADTHWLGTLVLYSEDTVQYDQIFPIEPICRQLQTLMRMRFLFSQSQLLSTTDRLTGLLDYGHFMMSLEREIKRSQRYGLTFSLAIIDIDSFRQHNENWGHLVGDEIIRTVAGVVQRTLRTSDIMARSGAEEIMVLLPETGPDNAQIALERLREEVAKKPVQWQDQSLDVSVCIGMLSVIEGECPTVPELLKRLDESLTIAQRVGHNQIFCETLVMENAEDGNVAE